MKKMKFRKGIIVLLCLVLMLCSTLPIVIAQATEITGSATVTVPDEGAYKRGSFYIIGDLSISITKTQTETAESYYVKPEVFADGGFPIISTQDSIIFSQYETGTKTTMWSNMGVAWSTTADDDGTHTANAKVSYKPIVGGTWTSVTSDTNNFIVDNTPPTAAFTHSVSELTVNFDASGSTDATSGIDRYEWDFGDGGTGSGVSPSHTYPDAGTYTVTLKVWDKAGNDGTGTAQVAHPVSPVPELPSIVLLSIGLLALAGYVILKRKK